MTWLPLVLGSVLVLLPNVASEQAEQRIKETFFGHGQADDSPVVFAGNISGVYRHLEDAEGNLITGTRLEVPALVDLDALRQELLGELSLKETYGDAKAGIENSFADWKEDQNDGGRGEATLSWQSYLLSLDQSPFLDSKWGRFGGNNGASAAEKTEKERRKSQEENLGPATGDQDSLSSATRVGDGSCLSLLRGELSLRRDKFAGSPMVRLELNGVYIQPLGTAFLVGRRKGSVVSVARRRALYGTTGSSPSTSPHPPPSAPAPSSLAKTLVNEAITDGEIDLLSLDVDAAVIHALCLDASSAHGSEDNRTSARRVAAMKLVQALLRAEQRLLFGNATDSIAGTANAMALPRHPEQALLAGALWLHFKPVTSGHDEKYAHIFDRTVAPPTQTESDRLLRQRILGGDGLERPVLRFDADVSLLRDWAHGHKNGSIIPVEGARKVKRLHLQGETRLMGRLFQRAAVYATLACLAATAEVLLLLRQMRVADSSQAAAARVSSKSLVALAAGDAYIAMVHLAVAIGSPEPLFHAFALASFVKFVGFSLFTLRMLMSVLRAGTNNHAETRTAVGDQADAALAVGDTTSSRSVAFRVALVHIVRRVGNFVAGADQERSSERLDAGQVYCRFYLVLFGVALLAWLLGDYGVRVVVLLLGFGWGWPQIGNNAWRDTTTHKSSGPSDAAHALTTQSCFDTRYAMMAMVARSFVPLYMWACPRNVANVQVSPGFSLALLLWVAAQLVVWRCQEMFGPRFFLPAFLLPPKYNYQRQLPARLRHDQDGMAAGSVDLESGNATMGDCVICMSPVVAPDDFVGNGAEHVNVNEGGNHDHDSDAEESDGRYAIAPCDHLFHARCLERWMERKMECPTCRRALPDL